MLILLYQISFILDDTFYDPGISQIEKILFKICPKFLDLYASIYRKLDQLLKKYELKLITIIIVSLQKALKKGKIPHHHLRVKTVISSSSFFIYLNM
jgi:hypothetical protein